MVQQGMGERMIRLELKYCECCGGLLLRKAGGEIVYCRSCAKKMNELPSVDRALPAEGVRQASKSPSQLEIQGCSGGEKTFSKMGPKSVGVAMAEERRLG
jgi:hypothetical protein